MLQPLDWLLLTVPAAFAIRYVPARKNETLFFIITGLPIIPLAGWMGQATGHLSAWTAPGNGGLLNATFGNAAELIIALMALSKILIGVVNASFTGSIIGNILLVVGASMLAGGMLFNRQTFNKTAAHIPATSLSLVAMGLIISRFPISRQIGSRAAGPHKLNATFPPLSRSCSLLPICSDWFFRSSRTKNSSPDQFPGQMGTAQKWPRPGPLQKPSQF
jgi:calcium/proton exchanger cax